MVSIISAWTVRADGEPVQGPKARRDIRVRGQGAYSACTRQFLRIRRIAALSTPRFAPDDFFNGVRQSLNKPFKLRIVRWGEILTPVSQASVLR